MSQIDDFLDGKAARPAQKSQLDTFLDSAPPPSRGFKGWAGDALGVVARGAISVPEAAVGLLDIPTGGAVGKALENEGGSVGLRFKQAKEAASDLFDSDATKQQNQQFQQADGIVEKAKVALSNPSMVVRAVGESVPSMIAGGAAARGLMAATKLGQMGAAGAALAGAAGEGITAAGSAAEQIRQETPDGLLTPTQAALAAGTGVATAGFGVLGGRVANKLGIGDAETMLAQGTKGMAKAEADGAARAAANPLVQQQAAKSIPRQVISGAISEGFLEELPQSVAEQIFQNVALGKDWLTDVDSAVVMGVLSGGAMGGAAAGYHGIRQPKGGAGDAPTAQPGAVPADGGAQPGAAPTNPGMERIQQAFAAQLAALQQQEQGDPTVPQTAPPDGAAALAQQQAQAEAQRQAAIDASRAVQSPDDEIYQSTGATVPRSVAMGLDPAAGPLSAGAALAVDTGVSDQMQQAAALAQAAEVAQKQGKKPAQSNQKQEQQALTQQGVNQETGEISQGLPMESWSDAQLSNTFRGAQSREVRMQLAQELGRRRALREQQELQAELDAEQRASVPGAERADAAFASLTEDAGPVPADLTIPATTEGNRNGPQAAQAQQGSAQPSQVGAAPAIAPGAPAAQGRSGANGAQQAAAAGLIDGAPTANPGAQAAPAAGAQAQAQGSEVEALRQKLRDVEDKIIAAAPSAMGQGGGDIEAAMKSRKVPVTLKAQHKRLKEQLQQAKEQQAQAATENVATDAEQSPAQETTHNGTRIYPTKIKMGDEVKSMWAVESPDNQRRRAAGERTIGGDSLHDTIEQAKAAAEREAKRDAEQQAAKAEQDAADKARRDAEEARKAANRPKSVVERRKDAILDGPSKIGQGTKRAVITTAVDNGYAIEAKMVYDHAAKKRDQEAVDRASRAGYILGVSNENLPLVKAGNEAKARLKEGKYEKPEYRVYQGSDTKAPFREITKTEYDYAQELKAQRAAAPQAEAAQSTTTQQDSNDFLPEGWTKSVNGFTKRPVYRMEQGVGQPFAVVTQTEGMTYEVQIRHGDKQLTTSTQRGALSEVLAAAEAELGRMTQADSVTHADPGEKAEAATPAVVTDSLKKAARNEDTKPSEMRKWLVAEIDKELLQAPDRADYDEAVKRLGEKDAISGYTGNGPFGKNNETGYITFDVPGDGKYKVRNSVRGLLEFRKNVMASQGFKDSGQKRVKPEQNDGVQGGSGGNMAAITNMVEEGDFEAARDYAEAVGVSLEDVKVPRGENASAWKVFLSTGKVPEQKPVSREWNITNEQNPNGTWSRVAKLKRTADGAEYEATVTGTLDNTRATYVLTKDGKEYSRMTSGQPFSAAIELAENAMPAANDKPAPNKAKDKPAPAETNDTGWTSGGQVAGGRLSRIRTIKTDDGRTIVARLFEWAGRYEDGEVNEGSKLLLRLNDSNRAQERIDAFLDRLVGKTPALDLMGFKMEPIDDDGGFRLQDGSMIVTVERTDTGLQARHRSAKSSPRLTDQQAVEWAANIREESQRTQAAPAPAGRTYLAVPFNEKDYAKRAGAKWDEGKKLWYADPVGGDGAAAGEININLKQYVPQDSTKDDRYNYYGDKALATAVALNASARDGVQYDTIKRKHPDGMMMWSVVKAGEQTQAAGSAKSPTRVTPQISGNPEKFIKVAADSVREMRSVDVDRVLTETPVQFRAEVASYIRDQRKDLADEVDDVMADIQPKAAAPAPAPSIPVGYKPAGEPFYRGGNQIQGYAPFAPGERVTMKESAGQSGVVESLASPDDAGVFASAVVKFDNGASQMVPFGKLEAEAKTAPTTQPEAPKLTPAEAKSLMEWQDLGQKDGVKTHALTFYESQADKDAKRGRMIVAKVSKGDRSANNWMVEGDDKPLAVLGMAKKRAEEIGMAKAVADGFVEPAAAKPAAAKPAAAPQPEAPAAPITDFGEKIGGARKDVWSGFKDDLNKVLDDDIAGQPLTKVWPAPDYQKLIDAGMNAKAVAAVRALRDEVPAKPRAAWKVKRWAEQVKTLRGLANDVMDGKITVQDMERMGANKGTSLRGMMGRIELYELVGHEKSLEGVRFAHHHYALYKGRENVSLWVVEKDAGASAFSNWPREIATGDTKEQALAAFKEKYAGLDLEKAVRKASFDIFSERGSNAFYVGKKIGRNYAKLEGPFNTVREAREYREKNLAALEAKLEKYKEIPRERADVNQPRVGVDMRNGQDVTPQMFGEVFGFRGVEFGNWVEQKRRQKDLNDAFDALMDMAAVLDIPPKAISLNGQLGLAFGARGSGGVNPAAAHYEPDNVVINLTKKEGAGSLGHEWWHALDNYFAKQRKVNRGSFMTTGTDVGLAARGKDYYYEGGIRQEMIDAFGAVVKAINLTAMKARASTLDGKRTKDYWTTGEEMSARAFESYLISKLQDQNASNDYLANVVSEETWNAMAALGMENENSYPYPTAAEIPAIRAGFDHFFQTVETRETEGGNVAMFSSADSALPAKPLSLNRVNQLVQEALSGIRGAPPVEVTARPADVGLQVPAGSVGYGVTLRSGDIYVFQSAMGSDLDVFKTVFHELFHRGVRVLVPKGQYVQTMLDLAKGDSRIQQLAIEWKNTEMGQKQKENLREQGYTGAELTGQYEALAIEEALAAVAEEIKAEGRLGSKPKNMTIRFLANWLAKLADLAGMKKLAAGIRAMTYNEAERFVMSAIDRSGEPVQAGRTDNLSAKQAAPAGDQTQTEAFKRWFKDSKVVDAEGKPQSAVQTTPEEAEAVDGSPGDVAAFRRDGAESSERATEFDVGSFLKAMGRPSAYSEAAQRQAIDSVSATVDAIRTVWGPNAPEVVVAFDMQDERIPEAARKADLRQRSGGARGAPEGFYYRGKAYLMASRLNTPNDAARVLYHEVLGHHGLRGKFGRDLDQVLNQIATMRKAEVAAKMQEYGLRGVNSLSVREAAEEVLAEMAEKNPQLPFVQRAISAIRNFLRTHVLGFQSLRLTDSDIIQAYILPARGWVERGGPGGPGGGVSFSRDAGQMEADALRLLAAAARSSGNENTTLVLGPVTDDALAMLQREGVPVEVGYRHTADMYAVRHALSRHGDAQVEAKQGQLPLIDADIAAIPEAIAAPDAWILGAKTPRGQDIVGNLKRLPDGTVLYLEEVRSGRKALAMTSMRKYPGTTDFETIRNRIVPSYAQSDTGDVRIVYPAGAAGQGEVLFSRSSTAGLKDSALQQIHQALTHPGKVSLWDKTVGTMRNLAERSPVFKPVYEAAQRFIDDVSMLGNDAADRAPRLLPRVETLADLKKKPITAADNQAVAKPLFEGTLLWARDVDGTPVTTEALNAKYRNTTPDEKAQILLRTGKIQEQMLKVWRGLPVDQYNTIINNKFDSTILKPGVVWTAKELKDLFDLSAQQVSLYQEARAAIDRSIDMTARADMLRALGAGYAGLREAVLAQASVEDAMVLITDTLQAEAREFPDQADRILSLNNAVVKSYERAQALMEAGYAPLSRFGRYTVDVVAKDGTREYFGMFESMYDSNKMKAAMEKEFPGATVTQGTMSDEAFKLFQGITPESLEHFGEMLGLSGDGTDPKDKAFQAYLQLAKNNHSALKRLIHRKGISGYSEDVGRVLASFVYSNARLAAGGLNAGTLETAIEGIPKEQGELRDVAMALRSYIQDPQEEGQAVRGMLFAQYLGGSVASAMVNMTQPFQITMPWLSQFGGLRSAASHLAGAVRDMTRRTGYEPDLAKALQTAEAEGIVSPQEIHQLMAQARGAGSLRTGDGTKLGDARAAAANNWERVKVAWGQPFALAEQFNRRSTFIAAYRIAKEQGMADPAKFAERAVQETQFVYSKANKPKWARGTIGGTLFTFKTYSVSYLELMHRMWSQGGPEGKRAVGWAVAMLLLMGGAGGLPFMEDAEDLIDGAGQLMGYNISTKHWRKQALRDVVGKELADFMEQGVSGLPGAPIDVSGRLGMGNLIPGTGLLLAKQNRERDLLEVAGPAGDLVARGFTGARKLLTGDVAGAALEVSPTAARNWAKGIDMGTSGIYKDAKGYKVIDTTLDEAIAKFAGFQPKSVAEVQEANSFMQRSKSFYIQTSNDIKAQWAKAVFEKDDTALQRVRDRLAAWNRNNPDQPIVVKIPDVMKRVREMGKDRTQRIEDTAPKALRSQMREMARENG